MNNGSFFKKPYNIINLIFAGIILAILVYSGIFSSENGNHPVKCIYEEILGRPCPTCGLSNSFSEIVRGNFEKARLYNENGIPVFLFFLLQFILRIITSLIYQKKIIPVKVLVFTDVSISVILFLTTFKNLLAFLDFF